MNATLNTSQLRLVVLLVLVVVLGGGYYAVAHKSTTQTSTARTTPAVTAPAHDDSDPEQGAHAAGHAGQAPATHGLPVTVALALRKHSVVVVALSSSGAGLDKMAAAEAKAGAIATRAGFVNLDVLKQRQGTAILHKLGVVDTPAVLVVKRPRRRLLRLQGLRRPRRGRPGRRRRALMRRGGRPKAAEPEPRELFVRSASRYGRPVVTMRARDLGDACVVDVEVEARDEGTEPQLVQLRRRAAGEHVRDGGRRGPRLPRLRDPRLRDASEEPMDPVPRDEGEFQHESEPGRRHHRPSSARAVASGPGRPRLRSARRLHHR